MTYCVSGVVGMNGDGCISQHRFGSSSSNDNPFVRSFNLVRERRHDSEFETLFRVVSRNRQESSSSEDFLIELRILISFVVEQGEV